MMETEQIKFWQNSFGNEYVERNSVDVDERYSAKYGITRTALNREFIGHMPRDARILEVGCNNGRQLKALEGLGFTELYGIEINRKALGIARQHTHLNVLYASAFDIPFRDGFFDVVYTSGVLIHIHPHDLPRAFAEMRRVTRRYIWGFEYFAETLEAIPYRGHNDRMWKGNYAQQQQKAHPDLKLVKEKKVPYLADANRDQMYLLEK